MFVPTLISFFFFFNDTATTEIYTLSLHDALPISPAGNPPPGPNGSRRAAPPGAWSSRGPAPGAAPGDPPHRRTASCTTSLEATPGPPGGPPRRRPQKPPPPPPARYPLRGGTPSASARR